MDRQFIKFVAISTVVVIVNFTVMWWFNKDRPAAPRKKAAQVAAAQEKKGEKEADKKAPAEKAGQKRAADEKDTDKKAADEDKEAEAKPKPKPEAEKEAQAEPARKEPPLEWVSLGSTDPSDPYRMLATITNRGAAVERIELSSRRFHDVEDRSGYLGHLEGTKPR